MSQGTLQLVEVNLLPIVLSRAPFSRSIWGACGCANMYTPKDLDAYLGTNSYLASIGVGPAGRKLLFYKGHASTHQIKMSAMTLGDIEVPRR